MEQTTEAVWKWLGSTFPAPRYLRRVVRHPFDTFQSRIMSGDFEFTKRITESLYAGDFLILSKAAMPEALWEIRKRAFQWGKKTKSGIPMITESCPNTHFSVGAIEHSYNFYRWNKDEYGVFTVLDKIWKIVKVLSGPVPEQLNDARAQEEIVEKAQILHFPPGAGRKTMHSDPVMQQKANFGFPLTVSGKDYSVGGTFVMVTPTEKHNVERYVEPGDGILFFPSLWHGVDTIDPSKKADLTKIDGRWYMAGYTVSPHSDPSPPPLIGMPNLEAF